MLQLALALAAAASLMDAPDDNARTVPMQPRGDDTAVRTAGTEPTRATDPSGSKRTSDKLLVLDVAGDGDAAERRSLADAMAALLHEHAALDVTPASALRDRLTLEADRAETGCDDGSCAAEAADAIGARFVVFSRLTSLSGGYLLRLEAFDGRDARAISIVTLKGDSIVSLSSALAGAIDVLIARSDGVLPRREAPVEILHAPGFFERPGNTALVTGSVLIGVAVVTTVGYVVPALLMAGPKGDHERALDRYLEEPSEGNGTQVAVAYDRAQQFQGVHLVTGTLLFVAPLALIGALTAFIISGAEKAQ